jgi:uncharacterized protein involved in exopolysaccharide biosynthesis
MSVASSYFLPNFYKSTALLEVASGSSQINLASSSMSGLASMAGISLPGSTSGDSTSFIVETLQSRDFVKNLIAYEEVLPSLMAAKSFDAASKKINFDDSLYDVKEDEWIREVIYPYSKIPSILEVHKELNEKVLSVSVDKKTGYITLSIEHISPVFAQKFIFIIIDELNKVSRNKDLKESEEAINFLKNEASKSSLSPLNNSISRLIESKLETQMMAQIHEDYLLRFIDKPYLPEKKSWPKRTNILIISFFVSLLSILFYFTINFFTHKKD